MSYEKLQNDPDFIYAEEYGNSIRRALKANENGVSDTKIMHYLKLNKEDMEKAIENIKDMFGDLL
jgi:phosphoribosylformylglycinamidine (FGAM) synthase PurS component